MDAAARLTALRDFDRNWRELIGEAVRFEFARGEIADLGAITSFKADAFVEQQGFNPIGFNWELLDPGPDLAAPRSACATMVEALSHDLSQPSTDWLGTGTARACAKEFLGAFDPATLSVVTNHLNGLWWPVSDAKDEWTFVAMDDQVIAMFLMAR